MYRTFLPWDLIHKYMHCWGKNKNDRKWHDKVWNKHTYHYYKNKQCVITRYRRLGTEIVPFRFSWITSEPLAQSIRSLPYLRSLPCHIILAPSHTKQKSVEKCWDIDNFVTSYQSTFSRNPADVWESLKATFINGIANEEDYAFIRSTKRLSRIYIVFFSF